MAMTTEQFVEMVSRLEEYAGREPKKYRLRVGLLAALGYAYILFVLGVVVALLYLLVWLTFMGGRFNVWVLKFGWVLLVLAWFVLRSLWIKIPAPEGVRLTREEAPGLFALADEIAEKLEAPRPHVIQVDGDFNASIAQVPRLGPFGWHRNYLTVGLPLIQALTPEQFRAVLAHELGHLSGNHGRFGSWIYRVRLSWVQLLTRLEREEHWGSFIFDRFVNWFAPYFDAYSFVLARLHEYDADRASARLTSPREAAVALAAVGVKGAYLSEKYWPEIFKRAEEQREPTAGAFAGMWPALRAGVAPQEARAYLLGSLARETGYGDTHPSLKDRLAALGLAPTELDKLAEEVARKGEDGGGETAAEHYLGELRGQLSRRLDAEWCQGIEPSWRERHEYVTQSKRGLAALEEKARTKELSDEEAWQRAEWTAEFKGLNEAVPLLRELTGRRRTAAAAHSMLGQILIAREDAEGVEHLEKAMAADPDYVPAACQVLYGFMRSQGRDDEAEAYRRRLLRHIDSA